MFTRLLVGLDGSSAADVALEQAVELGRRFHATVVVAHVRERGAPSATALLERARTRVLAAELEVETLERSGDPEAVLGELALDADCTLVGRRGTVAGGAALGATVAALVRTAEKPVIVCGGSVSPMRQCGVAFDGRGASLRALDLAGRYGSIAGSTVHLIHANDDRDAGLQVVGQAEAVLSLHGVPFVTHVEAGLPAEVVGRVVRRIGADALFAGAHVAREAPGRPSPVVVSHAEEILRRTDIPVVIQP
jgi:nucleotide-binding universal stress UspA family protein